MNQEGSAPKKSMNSAMNSGLGIANSKAHSHASPGSFLINEEKDALWELLGNATTVQSSPNFTQKTVELARMTPQEKPPLASRPFQDRWNEFVDVVRAHFLLRPLPISAAAFVVLMMFLGLRNAPFSNTTSSSTLASSSEISDEETFASEDPFAGSEWIANFYADTSQHSPDEILFGAEAASALHRVGNHHVILEHEAMLDGNDELMLMLTAL